MDRQKILQYVQESGCAEVARLQRAFDLSYREATDFVGELVTSGALVFRGGVQYDYVEKEQPKSEEDEEDDISRWLDLTDVFEDEPEQEDADLRFKALDVCIRRKLASSSMLQRSLNIGFSKASELLEWMEQQGYITPPIGKWGRRDVLLTQEEFEAKVAAGEFGAEEKEEVRPIGSDLYEFYYWRVHDAESSDSESTDSDAPPPTVFTWFSDSDFAEAIAKRIEDLVKANPQLGLKGAIKRAQICYEAVLDTDDTVKSEVYARILYELAHTSPNTFLKLKKKLLEGQGE